MIDSHCHLFFDSLINDFDSIISRAKKNNISAILSINTNPIDFESHYRLINTYNSLFISNGQHPENVNFSNIPSADYLKSFCKNEKVIGIGETGLDFYHSTENKKEQFKSFENHIECSYDVDLPLIIHQRNSENEIIDILNYHQKRKKLNVVFHCFTGSSKLRNFCLDNNFYISLSGIITFKNAEDLRKIIQPVPLNLILIETDSPFLAPTPNRGKTNEPSYVYYIGKYLANFFNLKINEFEKITNQNFYNLFSKAIIYNEIS